LLTRKYLLLSVGVIASLLVLTAIEGAATGGGDPLPSFGVEMPPRECTVSLPSGLGNVTIQAGPHDEHDGLAEIFPIPDACPPGVGLPVGQCLKWTYQWIFPRGAATLVDALVSIDTDITVLASDPSGATISRIIPVIAEGERVLKFNATTNTFKASYWTPPGVGPGTLTAGFVAKKGFWPLAGRCALAGADDRITGPDLPVTTQVIDQVGDCLIQRTIGARGCTVKILVVEQPSDPEDSEDPEVCTVEENLDLMIAGSTKPSIAIGCGTQITDTGGSKRYCYPTPTGKMTCITVR
jgi:hypothetical protein